MSKYTFWVRYKVAPSQWVDKNSINASLMALGLLLGKANEISNGPACNCKTSFSFIEKQNAFKADLTVYISFLERIKAFIGFKSKPIQSAKDIARWVGLIDEDAATPITFLKYIALSEEEKTKEQVSDDVLKMRCMYNNEKALMAAIDILDVVPSEKLKV